MNRWLYILFATLAITVASCVPPDKVDPDPNGLSTKVPDGFPNANQTPFDSDDRLEVTGSISGNDDIDVYDLGPLSLGDQLIVTCSATPGSGLDPMIALFDADGFRVLWNDDLDISGGNFDARVSGTLRHDSEQYFLAVTTTSFFRTTGSYRCILQLQPGVGLEPLLGQPVVLHFDSATNVVISGSSRGNLPAFDAANVNPRFEGRTAELSERILEVVSSDYAPYNVPVLTTGDDLPDQYTTVYFGISSNQLFGLADDVDFYNGNPEDNAIVFLESLGRISNNFSLTAQAIANVISHEIGHTLGLMHTNDATTLMDTTGSDITLLSDQEFGAADVVDFPIGQQNAPQLLLETVGRAPASTVYHCGTCGATLKLLTP